jgi:hypothetical protein
MPVTNAANTAISRIIRVLDSRCEVAANSVFIKRGLLFGVREALARSVQAERDAKCASSCACRAVAARISIRKRYRKFALRE